jgi:cell shape-determining protein MreC
MSQIRFNQAFAGLMAAGVASMFFIPPSVTDRAKGKEELLLLPVVKPVRAIASAFSTKYGDKPLPPGETRQRADSELAAENAELRQHVVYLNTQLAELQNVDAERKRLGPLLTNFETVSVIGGDASPVKESLSLMPRSGVDLSQDAPIISPDGFVGTIDGNRVRLLTQSGVRVPGKFGRFTNGQWTPVAPSITASVLGQGEGRMRIEHLFLKDVTGVVNPGDWVVVADWPGRYANLINGHSIGQVDSVGPSSKAGFADIVVKPRGNPKQLREVLAVRKK